jgi:hypothetical protein
MKVEFQCGDTITIPDGCRAIVKDGSVVFEKLQEFKDGDILVSIVNGHRHNAFIYKNTDIRGFHSYYIGLNMDNLISIDNSDSKWGNANLSYATESEKQQLFDLMNKKGLKWNAEEKRVEKIRWRAKEGEHYSLLDRLTFKVDCYTERFDEIDTKLYNSGNYFRTNEQAEEAAKRVKEVLRKYHEEIGE